MWEAFLVQMDDFDRFLKVELRQMLDPVVATKAPGRPGRPKAGRSLLALMAGPWQAIPPAEPVVVPVRRGA
jgi:hypothetical protein